MTPETVDAVVRLLRELLFEPGPPGPWVIDGGEPGLIGVLERLSAAEALREPGPGRMSVAAHAAHVTYSLSLLNRWANGEPNPFATADWAGSWQPGALDDASWQERLDALRSEATAWIEAVQRPREWDEIALTGTLASVSHVAYHLGAVKQLVLLD